MRRRHDRRPLDRQRYRAGALSADLPAGLFVEGHLATVTARGGTYYITQKGNHGSGVILLKIVNRAYECALYQQQRDFMSGRLDWINPLNTSPVAESEADHYIQRQINFDPDLWVIEIEQETLDNPFE